MGVDVTIYNKNIIINENAKYNFEKYKEWYKRNFTESEFRKEMSLQFFNETDWKWIKDNWVWLTNHFKDEKEILVLKIESWEE